jgi:hypothetical protein
MPKLQLFAMTAFSLTTCAPATPPKTAVQPASFVMGRILLARPVSAPAADGPLRAVLFEDVSGAGQDEPVEFIVRTDDGTTLSIVQDNQPGFHAGDRVMILRDDHARLARPS